MPKIFTNYGKRLFVVIAYSIAAIFLFYLFGQVFHYCYFLIFWYRSHPHPMAQFLDLILSMAFGCFLIFVGAVIYSKMKDKHDEEEKNEKNQYKN